MTPGASSVVVQPTVPIAPSRPQTDRIKRDWLEHGLRFFAARPFAIRRVALKAFFRAAGRFALSPPPDQLVQACGRTLSLSQKDSRRFLRRAMMNIALFQMEWLALAYRSKAGLLRDTRHITLARQAEIAWLASQRGAILGTMHFGPYSLGLVWLLHRYFAGRTVIIVKTRTEDPDEQAAIARLADLGVDLRFAAPTSQGEFMELAKLVRRGAFAIMMVDLPPHYGRASSADTLGHTLHFTDGAVDLAALCQVPLALFRTRSELSADVIEIADIFDVRRGDDDARQRAVGRVHRFITRTITTWPEQWHMWMRFREYHSLGGEA